MCWVYYAVPYHVSIHSHPAVEYEYPLKRGLCVNGGIQFQILARCCPNLKKLALCGCELIGDDGLEAVAYYCRGLTQLNIRETPVTLRGYRAVKKFCKRCVIEHTNPGFCWQKYFPFPLVQGYDDNYGTTNVFLRILNLYNFILKKYGLVDVVV